MADSLAPVVIFAYKRLFHVQRLWHSLIQAELAADTDVVVFCDGPKNLDDALEVEAVRSFLLQARGTRSIRVVARQQNLGLSGSLIQGVSEVLRSFGRIIVVEDDLILSRSFLRYMNQALTLYEHEAKVASIHAWHWPLPGDKPETYFLRGADCWGWATWSRAWKVFDSDGAHLLQGLREQGLCRAFDFDGTYPYTQMLRDQVAGRNNSWAIRWHASAYLQGLLTLYPGKNLVGNEGFDGSGTHCDADGHAWSLLKDAEAQVQVEKIALSENLGMRQRTIDYFTAHDMHRQSLMSYAKMGIKTLFPSMSTKRVKKQLKRTLKQIVPPGLKGVGLQLLYGPGIVLEDGFASWAEAQAGCRGYDDAAIGERVATAARKVRDGQAAFERDSVTFSRHEQLWPQLACLLRVASENGNSLSVLDFGGSLGSSYFQNRNFLGGLKQLRWNVVEQAHFVALGRQEMSSESLQFYYSIREFIEQGQRADLVLLSSVLQYIEDPEALLGEIFAHNFNYLLIDRMPLTQGAQDIIVRQIVPKSIYEASYPARIFGETSLLNRINQGYELLATFSSEEHLKLKGEVIPMKGLFFKRRARPLPLAASFEDVVSP